MPSPRSVHSLPAPKTPSITDEWEASVLRSPEAGGVYERG